MHGSTPCNLARKHPSAPLQRHARPGPDSAMRPLKRFLRSELVLRALCWTIHLYIRLVYATGKWEVEGAEIPRRILAQGKPFILAFWHGRLLMMPMAWQ